MLGRFQHPFMNHLMLDYKDKADAALVSLLRNGDERAFTELYNRYWKKLFVVAVNRNVSLEDAEEIVQDIFAKLWSRRQTLDLSSAISHYLAVSVKYRVIKTLDKYFNHTRYVNMTLHGQQFDDVTQEQLAFNELQEELAKYVKQLPEKCRLVFKLSREDGYSQKQIAETLQISEKTVEAHLGKAFRILRSKLSTFLTTLL